ncbi:conjugal transfer protein TrbG [Anaerobiospirillum thomasii]|uniref:Conjugal transfer protein TrbG n=1 Tax=Anaerobiospirillum thomasii TaxID=179995 RepID=A0A2X0WMC0_9GAMM|nr:P-type conjugative transfer protein TrbG [Anaerobiospirillum thomasii]SPT69810.1 conjugal transfer protein TrbG [Anaerobiospirillum thomasii]SPT71587.1 conjugal transfer protein TrbG [Anaerobiospirillum thomasii]
MKLLPHRRQDIKYIVPILLAVSSAQVHADSAYDSYAQNPNGGSFLNDSDYETLQQLKDRDRRGVDGLGLNGSASRPGQVVFSYGSSQPSIVCAILHLTDIAFEPGEVINSVQIGDAARWSVDSAISGSPQGQVSHLIVKPLDTDLFTSMIVATDRRTYNLNLKSTLDDFMPSVVFIYPQQQLSSLNFKAPALSRMPSGADAVSRPFPAASVKKVARHRRNYTFELEGDEEIMPLEVYHDNVQTFIEMDRRTLQKGAPALVLIQEGRMFQKDSSSVINYRLVGSTYVVDGIFNKARLMLNDYGSNLQVDIINKG